MRNLNPNPNEPGTCLNIEVGNALAFPDPEHARHAKKDALMYSLGRCADYLKAMDLLQKLQISLRRRGGQPSITEVDVNRRVLLHLCVPVSCQRELADWVTRPVTTGTANDVTGGGGGHDVGHPMSGRKDITLHPKQREVIAGLKKPLELIHGPPGAW